MKTKSITDSNVVDAIRAQMDISTVEKKGLMPSSFYNNVFNTKIVGISPGKSILLGKVLGMMFITNRYINEGKPSIYRCGTDSVDKVHGEGFDLIFSISEDGLSVTSNYGIVGSFSFTYQNIQL